MNIDKFSARLNDVIRLSREEAIRLGHDYIGTEHLLLGIIREGEGIAVKILRNLGADLYKIKKAIEDTVRSSGATLTIGNIPLTKQAEKVLKMSFLDARLYRSDIVGTEHLLLSILRDEDNIAAQILNQFHVSYDGVKMGLDKIISGVAFAPPTPKPTLEYELRALLERYNVNSCVFALRVGSEWKGASMGSVIDIAEAVVVCADQVPSVLMGKVETTRCPDEAKR